MDKEKRWILYVHTNLANNKKYVGITSQEPEKRWMNGHGYARTLYFGRAIEKYGWNNFRHDILLTDMSEEEAKTAEIITIAMLKTNDHNFGYNLTEGGGGTHGYKAPMEVRLKYSAAKSGPNHPNYGKHRPEQTAQKISKRLVGNQNAKGVVRSDETKLKMSQAKMKPVMMAKDGLDIMAFDSAKDAELYMHISRKNISECCLGHRKRAGGYEWKFA